MKLSLKTKINLMFLFVIIVGSLVMALVMSNIMQDKVIGSAQEKLRSDLHMAKEMLDGKYPGEWKIQDNNIYKGGVKINDNFDLIDRIGELTNDTVTIFQGDTRVSTNVKDQDGNRAIGTKVSEDVAEAVLKNRTLYIGKAEVAGVWNQTIYDPIIDSNGNVIGMFYVGVPNTPYDKMAKEFQVKTYIFGVVLAIVASAFAMLFSKHLVKNINHIKNAAENIAKGDLTTVSIVDSKDEIEELSNSLNNMNNNLQNLIKEILSITNELTSYSGELSTSSDQNKDASEHMAETMTEIGEGNERQANSIDKVLTEAQQIAANAEELVAIANSMSTMTDETSNATKEGTDAIGKAVMQMENINNSTESVHHAINELTVSSNQINQILNVISGIAEQTNLLALNAAIEAASAGEAGRGFAVVAAEVRKLAEESQEATQEITVLINQNDKNIENANTAMIKGAEDVKVGMQVANTAKISFNQVERLAGDLASHIGEITRSIEQIAKGNQSVVNSVEDISEISRGTVLQTQAAAAMTEEQLASIEETTSLSHTLADMAERLQKNTRSFKI